MGQPKHAERYCGSLAPSITCLTEETSAPYYAYGLARGGLKEFTSLNTAKTAFKLAQQGIRGGQVIGDPLMMPGNFIVDQQGIVRYAFYASEPSEHPQMADILGAARLLRSHS